MSKQFKFLLWPIAGAPILAESGANSNFSDGITIELFSDAKNYIESNSLQFGEVTFGMTLSHNGSDLVTHSFRMEHMNGANIWLIANPALTKPNGSFTAAFADALCKLGAGDHLVQLTLEANGVVINQGEITFKNDGTNAEYQKLIPLFEDADAVRNAANKVTQNAYEKKREEEAAAKHAARYFKVNLENTNPSKTIYIIEKDHKSLSEKIREVLAGKTITIELPRGMTYDLLFYHQDTDKSSALRFATVNEQADGNNLAVY